jgi:two-component system chemotaxis response regulator CheB
MAAVGAAPVRLIVIGGSAGGIEALRVLLPAIPTHAPPVVVALHYPAARGGELVSLFGGTCACPVAEAMDKDALAAGTITFAPPGYHAMVEADFTVSLSVDALVHYSRPSIDVLFDSAAWSMGKGTLGIILSGANDDGATGLAAIRKAGGLAWVQSPDDSLFRNMPDAAIKAAAPHLVAGIDSLASKLRDWPRALAS